MVTAMVHGPPRPVNPVARAMEDDSVGSGIQTVNDGSETPSHASEGSEEDFSEAEEEANSGGLDDIDDAAEDARLAQEAEKQRYILKCYINIFVLYQNNIPLIPIRLEQLQQQQQQLLQQQQAAREFLEKELQREQQEQQAKRDRLAEEQRQQQSVMAVMLSNAAKGAGVTVPPPR